MDFSSNDNSGDSNNRNHGPPSRNGFNQNLNIDNNRNENGNGNGNHNSSNDSPLNFSFQEVRKQMKDFKKSLERLESRINNVSSRINNVSSRMDSFMYIIILMGVVIIINNCQLVYIIINK